MECPILKSDRLIFKPLDSSYASTEYVQWMNDPDVIKFLDSGGDYTMDKLLKYLKDVEKQSMLFWAISKEDNKHIGNIKIHPIDFANYRAEYGILIGDKSEWGKGYAAEATLRILMYCFSEELNLHKITLGVVEDNEKAVNLYKKLGFQVEGILQNHSLHQGKWCNSIRMAIFNPNWNE